MEWNLLAFAQLAFFGLGAWYFLKSVRKKTGEGLRCEDNIIEMDKLMLILLAIPVVTFIVCIFWIISSNGNLNRKNFAKAWMIIAVVGTILSGILAFGAFQFIVMDHYVDIHEHIEYRTPEEQFIEDFLTELNEV